MRTSLLRLIEEAVELRTFKAQLVSDGVSGEEFIRDYDNTHLQKLSAVVKNVLQSTEFFVTTGTTYDVEMIRGGEVFWNEHHGLHLVEAEAKRRQYPKPPVEVAPLLYKGLREKDVWASLGTWFGKIYVMSDPIISKDDLPFLFVLSRWGLDVCTTHETMKPELGIFDGFVYLAPTTLHTSNNR